MTAMQEHYVFSGFGGQGVMFAGQLLAYAAMDCGFEVTWIPSYGPEMRGGTAHCFVAISTKPIGSPIVTHPKVGLVFNKPSFTKYEPLIGAGGLLVYNASLIDQKSERKDILSVGIEASSLAEAAGSPRLMNMVMLSAALTLRPITGLGQMQLVQALHQHIPAHRQDMLDMNLLALEKGNQAALRQTEFFLES